MHAQCLARWQLHSAGSREETACRFCDGALPDWKAALTPAAAAAAAASGACPAPTMSVTFNGVVHHVVVRGGPGGYAAFLTDVRAIFGIGDDADVHLAFDCADPVTGALVKLNGAGAYQAAVHCASVSAAKRAAAAASPEAVATPEVPCPCAPQTSMDRAAASSTESEASALDDAIAAALQAGGDGRAGVPPPRGGATAARRPRRAPSRPRPPADMRRALASMSASLKRLQDAHARGGGVDTTALRALESRVADLVAALPAE